LEYFSPTATSRGSYLQPVAWKEDSGGEAVKSEKEFLNYKSNPDFIFWCAKCTFQFQPASLPRSLSQQLHERLQGEAIPLDQVPKIDTPSEGFSSGSQMGTLGEAHNMTSTSSRAPKTFLA
jgi:hypothetical protein